MIENYDKIILFVIGLIESIIIFILILSCNHYRSYILWKEGFYEYLNKYNREFDRANRNFELYIRTQKELTQAYLQLSKYETTARDNSTSQV